MKAKICPIINAPCIGEKCGSYKIVRRFITRYYDKVKTKHIPTTYKIITKGRWIFKKDVKVVDQLGYDIEYRRFVATLTYHTPECKLVKDYPLPGIEPKLELMNPEWKDDYRIPYTLNRFSRSHLPFGKPIDALPPVMYRKYIKLRGKTSTVGIYKQ